MTSTFLFRSRVTAAGLALSSALLLAVVFAFQYGSGLQPCTLCIWQRWPHVVVTVMAGVAFFSRSEKLRVWFLTLAGLLLWAGAGIALFHVGVEQHWWPGLASCTSSSGVAGTVDELLNHLRRTPLVACDKVTWSLFGVSMAGYNALISLALGGWAISSGRGRNRTV